MSEIHVCDVVTFVRVRERNGVGVGGIILFFNVDIKKYPNKHSLECWVPFRPLRKERRELFCL
jgi:hypothetical protein